MVSGAASVIPCCATLLPALRIACDLTHSLRSPDEAAIMHYLTDSAIAATPYYGQGSACLNPLKVVGGRNAAGSYYARNQDCAAVSAAKYPYVLCGWGNEFQSQPGSCKILLVSIRPGYWAWPESNSNSGPDSHTTLRICANCSVLSSCYSQTNRSRKFRRASLGQCCERGRQRFWFQWLMQSARSQIDFQLNGMPHRVHAIPMAVAE